MYKNTSNRLPPAAATAALSSPCLTIGSTIAAGLSGRGGAAALCIACETQRMSGVKAPVWYLQYHIRKVEYLRTIYFQIHEEFKLQRM